MSKITAIDADGHVIERESEIRKHLKAPWNLRTTALRPGDQPWDNYMFGRFVTELTWSKLSAREQVGKWHDILDEHGIETAVCFPTGSGSVVRLQELQFQIAVARACNDHFAADYNALSKRVKCVGVLPLRSPQAAAEELERAVKELGITAFEILPVGLPLALGDSFYDPVYAAAERCGAVLGIHGTRSWSRELGAEGLNTFAEVHAYAFTAGILLQFTSMICQGVPVRFPKLRFAFLEIGATWLPYYLDRLDEHWEKRAEVEMPLLKEKPSELVRKSEVYFSIEPGESQLPQTIEYVGADHFVWASDIPHWDCEFPGNLEHLRSHKVLPEEVKEKILYKNAKRLFNL
jgi:predicted TIM-barrel fold metal-dependent hydrolase